MSVPTTPQGPAPALGIPDSQDYPRLVFTAPYFETVPLAELIEPAVTEATEALLPSLVPPYVQSAAEAAVSTMAVLLTGSTMSGPLFLSPMMPTQPSQAASMAYVDAMLATAGIPEVPPTPIGQTWARQTGQWVPISEEEGTFLPLAGGIMAGQINMSGNSIINLAATPQMPYGAAPAQWVLQQIAASSLYQGTWNADTNTPDLTLSGYWQNGFTWIVITQNPDGVTVSETIPGLTGVTVFNGDTIVYSTVDGTFTNIHSAGLTLAEANALFVPLLGGQMSGALLLNSNATQTMQATPLGQVQSLIAANVFPEAPNDGQTYGRNGLQQAWLPVLSTAGGVLTGTLTLYGNAATALQATPLQQVQSLITTGTASYLPLAGGTLTGPVTSTSTFAIGASGTAPAPLTVGGYGITYLSQGAAGQNIAFGYSAGNFNAYVGGTAVGPFMSQTQANGLYVLQTGGTITGSLSVNQNLTATGSLSVAGLVTFSNAGAFTISNGGLVLSAAAPGGYINAGGNIFANGTIETNNTGAGAIAATEGSIWAQYDITAYRNMFCSGELTLNGTSSGISIPASAPGGYVNVGGNIVAGGTIAATGNMSTGAGFYATGTITGNQGVVSNTYVSAATAIYANGQDGGSYGPYGLICNPYGLWVGGASYMGAGLTVSGQITADGGISVPGAAPNGWLNVGGNIFAGGTIAATGTVSSSTSIYSTGNITTSSTDTGAIAATAGNIWAQYDIIAYRDLYYYNALINASDPRTKTDIADYTIGVSAISELVPITFRYNGLGQTPNDDETVVRVGLDASKVQTVVPQAVKTKQGKLNPTDADNVELLMLDTGPILMTLIKAVKQLINRVQALEASTRVMPPAADTA